MTDAPLSTALTATLTAARVRAAQPGELLASAQLPAVSSTQLAFYCAAIGVTDPIHYDREFARRAGFAELVVNGSLRVAWMAQALHSLVPAPGMLVHLSCSHRGMMQAGDAPRIEARYLSHEAAPDGALTVTLQVETLVQGQTRDTGQARVRLAPN